MRSHKERFCLWCLVMGTCGALGMLFVACGPRSPETREVRFGTRAASGIVVDEVAPDTALEEAGLEPGDVLSGWVRSSSFSGDSTFLEGEIRDPFDWWWLELEQSHRGPIELRGERRGKNRSWLVGRGLWQGKVIPRFSAEFLPVFRQGQTAWQQPEGKSSVGPDGAQPYWSQLEVTEANQNQVAWLYWHLGEGWIRHKQWAAAHRALETALKLLEPLERQEARLSIWHSIAAAYRNQRDFDGAREATTKVQELCRDLGDDSICGPFSQYYLGQIAKASGALGEAESYFRRSLAEIEPLAPRSSWAAHAYRGLGGVHLRRGEVDLAEASWLEAKALYKDLAVDSLGEAAILYDLSLVLQLQGHLSAAREAVMESQRITKLRDPKSFKVAFGLSSLSAIAMRRGDVVEADEYSKKALDFWQGRNEKSFTATTIYVNRAVILALRGDLENSEKFLRRAMAITECLVPHGVEMATYYFYLGQLARHQGDFETAKNYFLQDLELREKSAPRSLNVADTLEFLGLVSWDLEEPETARTYHRQALKIRHESTPGGLLEAHSLRNLGVLALRAGDLEEAQRLQSKAFEIYERLAPDSEQAAESLLELARIARELGKLEEVAALSERSLSTMEKVSHRIGRGQMSRLHFRGQKGEFFDRAIELLLESDFPYEAFHALERSRSRTFLEMLAERDLVFSADIPEELDQARRQLAHRFDQAQEKLSNFGRNNDRESMEEMQAELARLRGEADDLEETIRTSSARLASLQYPSPLDFSAVRETLEAGSVMLAFQVSKTRTSLFLVAPDHELLVREIPLGENRLKETIHQFREVLASTGGGNGDRQTWFGRYFYQQLIEPVEPWLNDVERVVVLPDGPLYYLPFGALIRDHPTEPRRPQFLAQWKPFHLSASATVHSELRERRRTSRASGASPMTIAALGDPVYRRPFAGQEGSEAGAEMRLRSATERGFFDWTSLPHTRREVQEITELYSDSQVYLGEEATEELVKGEALGARVIHFATHGFTDDRLPMNSGLVLSTPGSFPEDRDNGLLQVWEIYESVRFNADLVVLSACETGLGEVWGGEGLIGMTRAFQFAGARSVLASLWNVADEATSELMIRFHRHLSTGSSKDQALRLAQMELIAGPITYEDASGAAVTRDFSSPYYWAAFQLMGDWK